MFEDEYNSIKKGFETLTRNIQFLLEEVHWLECYYIDSLYQELNKKIDDVKSSIEHTGSE